MLLESLPNSHSMISNVVIDAVVQSFDGVVSAYLKDISLHYNKYISHFTLLRVCKIV